MLVIPLTAGGTLVFCVFHAETIHLLRWENVAFYFSRSTVAAQLTVNAGSAASFDLYCNYCTLLRI